MNYVLALVEGQTEEDLIFELLQPHLAALGVWLIPTVLRNSVRGEPVCKGGVSNWGRMRQDLIRLRNHRNVVAITTLLDYYKLPEDVPGMRTRAMHLAKLNQVTHVEAAMSQSIEDPRFRAYLSLHELEALLFADIDRWAPAFRRMRLLRSSKMLALSCRRTLTTARRPLPPSGWRSAFLPFASGNMGRTVLATSASTCCAPDVRTSDNG